MAPAVQHRHGRLGVLVSLGAVLLHGWWGNRSGRAGAALMAVAGVMVAIVGLAPWDTRPGLHDIAALGQGVAQWLAMGLLAVVAGRGRFRRLTLAAVVVSVIGFVAFVTALEGAAIPVLGFGGAERLSFDTLTVWTALTGAALLTGHGPHHDAPRSAAPSLRTGAS